MPKITVVLCTYNEGLGILRALKSLRNNDIYKNTEVIVVDDQSLDKVTIRLLYLLSSLTRFKVVSNPKNLGLSYSRNEGFKLATTDYIVPLDGDDTLPPLALDTIHTAFLQNPESGFLFGDYTIVDVSTRETVDIQCENLSENGILNLQKLAANWQLLGTSPCRKSTWEAAGQYNMKYSYSVQDVDFWIRAVLTGAIGTYVGEVLYNWNRSPLGMNASFDRLNMIRLLEDHQKFYGMIYSDSEIQNRIFEGYYPYKKSQIILPLIKRTFFKVTLKNKLRMCRFMLTQYR